MTDAQAPQTADILDAVCASVVKLLAASPRPPARLRVDAADHTVEIEWPAVTRAAAANDIPAEDTAADGTGAEAPRQDQFHVRAPAIGTFYRAPGPGAEPFIRVGDLIAPGQQIGILEAMKLMNPIEADRVGLVLEILVADGTPVEFGQPLLLCADDSPATVPNAGGREAADHAGRGLR
jgi:acetyl-CoA carboxylase biotin carboxyl carrier protein